MVRHERMWCGRLIPHPATLPVAIAGIDASIDVGIATGLLTFTIDGDIPRIPAPARPVRTDGLWHTTCFELFVRPAGGTEYLEFNFSPSTAWAAYRFDAYRSGMTPLPFAAPLIEPIERGVRITFDPCALIPGPAQIGLSAVIEETDGTKSYWALAHPPGDKPDFHDPVCFAARLA